MEHTTSYFGLITQHGIKEICQWGGFGKILDEQRSCVRSKIFVEYHLRIFFMEYTLQSQSMREQ